MIELTVHGFKVGDVEDPEIYAAVMASPNTKFYKQVAAFTKAFLDVEAGSFEMI